MTERVLPLADGASACPFVAFEDDRDERATLPDRRHRCYAEPRPAPRALAHQEAYCLSSAFPVCPIFQDWARREAARARSDTARTEAAAARAAADGSATAPDAIWSSGGGPAAAAGAVGAAAAHGGLAEPALSSRGTADVEPRDERHDPDSRQAADHGDNDHDDQLERGDRDDRDDSGDAVRRNPPRDWSAPPPWLASRDGRRADPDAEPPGFLGRRATEPGRGLAGSPADMLAGGPPPPTDDDDAPWTASSASAAAGRAALGGAGADTARRARSPEPEIEDLEPEDDQPRRPARRPRAYDQHLGGTSGPDWERPRRMDAYPTIKTRVGMPNVPRIALMAGLVIVFAIALYFLPAALGMGSSPTTPGGSPGASAAAQKTPVPSATVPPAPTPSVYTIKKGETLSKIAAAHGITIEELLAANPTITDPNKISEGQQIVLPVAGESAPTEIGGSAEPSAP